MTDIPISWRITMSGAKEAKAELAALQAEFGKTEGLKRFRQNTQGLTGDTAALWQRQAALNRQWKLQHQSLTEASRAMNVFGRAMRAGMSIMNTLNLLTVAQSSALGNLTKDKANILADLESIDLELEDMRKRGESPLKIALKENEKTKLLNELKEIEKQFEETSKNEAWTKWITAGFGIAEGVQTALQILNNKEIMKALTSMSGKMWQIGMAHGTIFGNAFKVGAAVSLALLADLIVDIIGGKSVTESLTGKRPTEMIKDATGVAIPNAPQNDIAFWITPLFAPLTSIITGLEKLLSPQKAYGEVMAPQFQGPIQDSGLRPTISGIASQSIGSISKVEITNAQELAQVDYKGLVTFRDLTTLTEENSEITTESNEIVKENTEIIKTEISAREAAKQREIELRNEVLANKLALIELTAAINKSMMEAAQATGTAIPTSGGGRGPYSSPSGFIGANGKMYSSASEAIRNNTQPIVNSSRQIVGYKAANGFDGMVNSPTMFLAGEAGAEQVSITPARRSAGGGGAIVVNNYVSGSVISERELEKLTMDTVKNILKRAGF